MKMVSKILVGFVLLFNTLYANESLNSIYENVILKNSKNSIIEIQKLEKDIQLNKYSDAKKEFSSFIKSWKSVESFYILGDLDDSYLDTPRYLDMFHQANEDITKQLDLIISSRRFRY